MHIFKLAPLLVATVASVNAKFAGGECGEAYFHCAQLDCTIEIVAGQRSLASDKAFRATVLAEAVTSAANLKSLSGLRVNGIDGVSATSPNGLTPPDASHPGKWWATVRAHRAEYWSIPKAPNGSDGVDLKGVAGVRSATLRYCKYGKEVCCRKP